MLLLSKTYCNKTINEVASYVYLKPVEGLFHDFRRGLLKAYRDEMEQFLHFKTKGAHFWVQHFAATTPLLHIFKWEEIIQILNSFCNTCAEQSFGRWQRFQMSGIFGTRPDTD